MAYVVKPVADGLASMSGCCLLCQIREVCAAWCVWGVLCAGDVRVKERLDFMVAELAKVQVRKSIHTASD